MGNKKKSIRPLKRKFCGNKYTRSIVDTVQKDERPVIEADKPCSSAKKIKLQDQNSFGQSMSANNGFILMDLGQLFKFLTSNMRCDHCSQYTLSCELDESFRSGYAHDIRIKCINCQKWETTLNTSGEGEASGHKEVNLRMVAFARALGRGYTALKTFSLYLNSPDPMTKNNYKSIFSKIHSASRQVATKSMEAAAVELGQRHEGEEHTITKLDSSGDSGVVDCAISVDGTWQRRGHASHHGVVTAISIQTGKCVDTEILSNICKGCQHWEERRGTQEFELWKLTHNCQINHIGSAGAMEAVGAVRIFSRSEDIRKLRYTQYLGDGDSSSFKKVLEAKPYGDREIEKLECVGHVQKRCGTRLRRLVAENKGRKLDDGKGIGGVGRLTNKKIDTLQNYFGFSIRQNAGNLAKMKADVKAVLHHVGSSDKSPNHAFCPSNSWCKYKLDPAKYKHKNGLPQAVIHFLEPVFQDLANEQLLSKCLHGKTQNNNECLNKLIWDRCSKEYFVEKGTVEEAVYSAVSYFNDGASSILKLFEHLGIQSGYFTMKSCIAKDNIRINSSTVKASETTQKRRKRLRAIRKGFLDLTEAREGNMYTPGGH